MVGLVTALRSRRRSLRRILAVRISLRISLARRNSHRRPLSFLSPRLLRFRLSSRSNRRKHLHPRPDLNLSRSPRTSGGIRSRLSRRSIRLINPILLRLRLSSRRTRSTGRSNGTSRAGRRLIRGSRRLLNRILCLLGTRLNSRRRPLHPRLSSRSNRRKHLHHLLLLPARRRALHSSPHRAWLLLPSIKVLGIRRRKVACLLLRLLLIRIIRACSGCSNETHVRVLVRRQPLAGCPSGPSRGSSSHFGCCEGGVGLVRPVLGAFAGVRSVGV